MDRLERNLEEMGRQHRETMGEIKAQQVNIESLHNSASELHASMIEVRMSITELRVAAQMDGENIRALAHCRKPRAPVVGPGS